MNQWTDEKDYLGSVINSRLNTGKFILKIYKKSGSSTIWMCAIVIAGFHLLPRELASEKLSEAKCQGKAALQVILESALADLIGE